MQGHRHAMHADVREAATRRQNCLADVEGGRYADSFNRHIDALTCGEVQHALNRTAVDMSVSDTGRKSLNNHTFGLIWHCLCLHDDVLFPLLLS